VAEPVLAAEKTLSATPPAIEGAPDVEAKMYEPHRAKNVGAKRGTLSALMLDAEATFDRMIVDRADDPVKAERILTNRVYRSIAGSLSGAQDYMAIERLHQLNASGVYERWVAKFADEVSPLCIRVRRAVTWSSE
jgi:hypothetical protein